MTDLLKKSLQESDLNVDVDYVVDNNIPVDVEDTSKISRGAETWLNYTNERGEKPIGPLAERLYEQLGPGKKYDADRFSIFNLNTPYVSRIGSENIASPFDAYLLRDDKKETSPKLLTKTDEKVQWLLEYVAGMDNSLEKGLVNGINIKGMDNATQMDLYSAYQFYQPEADIIPNWKYPDGKLAWDGIGRVLKYAITDPANLVGIGTFKPAFMGVEGTTDYLSKKIFGKTLKESAWKSLMNTSVVGMMEGGTWMLGDDYYRQMMEIHGAGTNPNYFLTQWGQGKDVTELKEYDPHRGLFSYGIGSAFGLLLTAVPGSAINGVASYLNRLKMSKNAEGETFIDFNDLETPYWMDENEVIESTMLNQEGFDSRIYFNDEYGFVPSEDIKTLYHGSPYSFDEFDMDKIGSGEGFQAYGYGIYQTETRDIGEQYRDQLSGLVTLTDDFVDGLEITPKGSNVPDNGNKHRDLLYMNHNEQESIRVKMDAMKSLLDAVQFARLDEYEIGPDLLHVISDEDVAKHILAVIDNLKDKFSHTGVHNDSIWGALDSFEYDQDFGSLFKSILDIDVPLDAYPQIIEGLNGLKKRNQVLANERDMILKATEDSRGIAKTLIGDFHRVFNEGAKISEEEFIEEFPRFVIHHREKLLKKLAEKNDLHNTMIEKFPDNYEKRVFDGWQALLNDEAVMSDITHQEYFKDLITEILEGRLTHKQKDLSLNFDIYQRYDGIDDTRFLAKDERQRVYRQFFAMFPEEGGDELKLSLNLNEVIDNALAKLDYDKYGQPLDSTNISNPSEVADLVKDFILNMDPDRTIHHIRRESVNSANDRAWKYIDINEDRLVSFKERHDRRIKELEITEDAFNDGKIKFQSEGSMTESRVYAPNKNIIDYDEPIAIDIPGPNQEIAIRIKTMLEEQGFDPEDISRLLTEEAGLQDPDYEFKPSVSRLLAGLEDLYRKRLDVVRVNGPESNNSGPEALRLAMVEHDIMGIKYLDGFSRGPKGKGSRNYVIMDPSIIKIAQQYSIPIPIASAILYEYMKDNNQLDDM